MYKRLIVVVSVLLFAMMAVLTSALTDLHDRTLPQGIGARAAVSLDTSRSGLKDSVAFKLLEKISQEFRLGLVRVVPDESGHQSRQDFVPLEADADFPRIVKHFGDLPTSHVLTRQRLHESYATGQYFVTNADAQIAKFKNWLNRHGIAAIVRTDTPTAVFGLLLRQSSFLVSVVSALVLMLVLVLFWFSIKARARAIRALAGVPRWRIHYEDLAGLVLPLVLAALASASIVAIVVGLTRGWEFVPYFATVFLGLQALLLVLAAIAGFAASVSMQPTASMLARRVPAIKRLQWTSTALKVVTFALMVAAISPAYLALSNAQASAAEQAQWRRLGDYATVGFLKGGSETEWQQVQEPAADVIREANAQGRVAFNYTFTSNRPGADASVKEYKNISLANPEWLKVMGVSINGEPTSSAPGAILKRLRPEDLSKSVIDFFGANLPLWTKGVNGGAGDLSTFDFYVYSAGQPFPAIEGGSGDLIFVRHALVVVIPDLSIFDDGFLSAAASSKSVVFRGLEHTQSLVSEHRLGGTLRVQNAAEEGLLRAQFTAYIASLQGLATIGLIVALVVAASVSAFITATLRAKHDFPLVLSGASLHRVLAGRVIVEWAVGTVIAALVIVVQASQHSPGLLLTVAAALFALAISPATHWTAARWNFAATTKRRQ